MWGVALQQETIGEKNFEQQTGEIEGAQGSGKDKSERKMGSGKGEETDKDRRKADRKHARIIRVW